MKNDANVCDFDYDFFLSFMLWITRTPDIKFIRDGYPGNPVNELPCLETGLRLKSEISRENICYSPETRRMPPTTK